MTPKEEEKKTDIEVVEPTPIEGEIDDIVIENEELLVVEGVESEETTKSTNDEDPEKGKPTEKSGEPEKPESSEKPKLDEATENRIRLLEKKNELLEKDIKEANLTEDQIRQRVPLADMKADIKRQRSVLAGIDKNIDPDEWETQNSIVTTLQGDIADKESAERIKERFNSGDNQRFLTDEKKALSDKGFDFSDSEWNTIAKVAENNYLVDGKYTTESIRKSMLDILGAEYTDKMYQVGSEQKIRKDIKDASVKVTKSVRVTRSGVTAKLSSLTRRIMAIADQDEKERALDKLTDPQYAIYKKEREKIKKSKK